MKRYSFLSQLKAWALLGLTISLASCGDQNEVFQKYLDQGERIYISIADSLTVLPGNQRAIVKWKVDSDPKLKDCVLKWSDADSVIVPIEKAGEQWLSASIDHIPEGEVNFIAYSRDIYGNNSLKSEKSKKIYGESYVSTLLNRSIASVEATSSDCTKITWNSLTSCIGVNLTYTNNQGKQVTRFVPGTEQETILEDAQLGTEFSYTSLFSPTEDCVDTFEVANPSKGMFPVGFMLDRSHWTITASSDASHKNDGGKPELLLDNNLNNYWHSSWSPNAPLPHWILIDMQKENNVLEVTVYKRSGNTDCKKIELYLSNDGENFNHIGDINYEKTPTPQGKALTLDTPAKGRYLKCVITESYRAPFVSLAEIKVMGR